MQKIIPHLWYDKEAGKAANFYMSLFKDSKLIQRTIIEETPSGDAELLTIELMGYRLMLISAGPYFKFNPSISLLVSCKTEGEVEALATALLEGGQALMPLGSYDFSPKYAWVMDRYGLSWQIMLPQLDMPVSEQNVTPTLMFVGDLCGRAVSAVNFYTDVFKDSGIDHIDYYGEGQLPNLPSQAKHIGFDLEGQAFAAMDSAYDHGFAFNEAVSLVVMCKDQEEIDYYWDRLSADPAAEQCGWLKDQFGLSWQINPLRMDEMFSEGDPEKLKRVTEAFLKMKKFDLKVLEQAYNG